VLMSISESAPPAIAETVLESSVQEFHRLSLSSDWVTVLTKGPQEKLPLSPQIYI